MKQETFTSIVNEELPLITILRQLKLAYADADKHDCMEQLF